MNDTRNDEQVRVEIRSTLPLPVTLLGALTGFAERVAAEVGAAPLYLNRDVVQEGPELVFRFTGQLPPEQAEELDTTSTPAGGSDWPITRYELSTKDGNR
jgi:hypothetical protein